MKFENTEVFNFKGALRGMRNPKDSWSLSDSNYCQMEDTIDCPDCKLNGTDCFLCDNYIIGDNDMKLAQALIKAGKEHRKFLRQIMVCVDITAPRYWWSEFDTYAIGVTKNSCSTMHKINAYPINIDMFDIDDEFEGDIIMDTVNYLEYLRNQYNNAIAEKDSKNSIKYLRAIKQRLPESFLQKRTVTMNYENLYEIVRQRETHRLSEWFKDTMNWIKTLPYSNEFIFTGERK